MTLQVIRDNVEFRSLLASSAGDADSADAWESIGIALTDMLQQTEVHFKIVEERRGWLTEAK